MMGWDEQVKGKGEQDTYVVSDCIRKSKRRHSLVVSDEDLTEDVRTLPSLPLFPFSPFIECLIRFVSFDSMRCDAQMIGLMKTATGDAPAPAASASAGAAAAAAAQQQQEESTVELNYFTLRYKSHSSASSASAAQKASSSESKEPAAPSHHPSASSASFALTVAELNAPAAASSKSAESGAPIFDDGGEARAVEDLEESYLRSVRFHLIVPATLSRHFRFLWTTRSKAKIVGSEVRKPTYILIVFFLFIALFDIAGFDWAIDQLIRIFSVRYAFPFLAFCFCFPILLFRPIGFFPQSSYSLRFITTQQFPFFLSIVTQNSTRWSVTLLGLLFAVFTFSPLFNMNPNIWTTTLFMISFVCALLVPILTRRSFKDLDSLSCILLITLISNSGAVRTVNVMANNVVFLILFIVLGMPFGGSDVVYLTFFQVHSLSFAFSLPFSALFFSAFYSIQLIV